MARAENSHKQEQTCVYTPSPPTQSTTSELVGFFFFLFKLVILATVCPQLGGKGDKNL